MFLAQLLNDVPHPLSADAYAGVLRDGTSGGALAGFAGQLSADLVDFPRDLTIFLNSKFFIQQIHKIPTSMDLSL